MKKYSVRLKLITHKTNNDGHSPIYVRITIDRKTSYISTGYHIHPKLWDDKNQQVKESHPLASVINPDITHKKTALLRSIVDTQIKGNSVSSADLKKQSSSKDDLHNIFDFIEHFSKEVKQKRKPGTLENYRKHALRLELFHGSRTLTFEDITPAYLQRYEDHLRIEEKNKKSVGANYTHALFKTLKTFFNAARKKRLISHYPFSDYENPVYSAPVKDYLSLPELVKWEEFADETANDVLKQTAIYFLLGCYSGLRISDWFAFRIKTHIVNDRLKLYAKKNGELVSMPISIPLQRNLVRMAQVPLEIEEPTINEKLKVIARKLDINKKITSHTGRHTFAITLCAEQGISSEVCATLMGISIKTCIDNYYKVTRIKMDKETLGAWENLK